MPNLDETHDPARRSWVESANDPATDFSIQNLPFGVFCRKGSKESGRIGVAIGDQVLDVGACLNAGLLNGLDSETNAALQRDSLNEIMGLGRAAWRSVRRAVGELLDSKRAKPQAAVVIPQSAVEMLLPARIGDYTDFYASIHHATNVGSMFRPDNPLLPNYKHLPVGYHGRASSIVVSGTPITRPMGQTVTSDAGPPTFGPCKLLDYEMELGVFVGRGNAMGTRIDMKNVAEHLFGMVIVNDWSARDIQKWEYQPLGPFNAKNFGTTISPWVVTMDALEPFRVPLQPRAENDPQPLDYLQSRENWGYDINVEVSIASALMRERNLPPHRVSRGNFRDMYWTLAQMLVHHTSTGCNLRPGDLLASGTISGPTEDSRGCLLERTWRGQNPIDLPDGTQRKFLQDGDNIAMSAAASQGLRRIGFGMCAGVITTG